MAIADPKPEEVPAWRLLPTEYEELCERVSVNGYGQYSNRAVFVHPDLESEDPVVLALRIQGVVTDININAMGNWTG